MPDSAEERATDVASADVRSALSVLRLERQGIDALATALEAGLGPAFDAAVDRLASTGGRVIVTGMGKSGHVARKIAATMASVGTPAFYLHPAEASHGDLGMVARADTVIALSNSGETPELDAVTAYCRRFSIPLVAITSVAGSALADAADMALVLPRMPEACPMGLAPTTSTTMMLALGDALAVALLERKGFSADDFQVLHPGGKLGRKLLRVSDIMHVGDALPLAAPETPMSEVLIVITAKRKGCVGIVDGSGRLVGIVTDGDLRRHMKPGLVDRTAGEVMTRDPQTIRPEALAAEALGLMEARKISVLFAVRDGRPAGVLHLLDCLQAGVA